MNDSEVILPSNKKSKLNSKLGCNVQQTFAFRYIKDKTDKNSVDISSNVASSTSHIDQTNSIVSSTSERKRKYPEITQKTENKENKEIRKISFD